MTTKSLVALLIVTIMAAMLCLAVPVRSKSTIEVWGAWRKVHLINQTDPTHIAEVNKEADRHMRTNAFSQILIDSFPVPGVVLSLLAGGLVLVIMRTIRIEANRE